MSTAAAGTPGTAAFLYAGAKDSWGVPQVDSRQNERSFHTTASATKLFDIFVQAAPEIIANINNPALAPACVLNGQSYSMFDGMGHCEPHAVSCLLGRPAKTDDLILCESLLDEADSSDPSDVAIKQRIVVATLLSAGHTCE